MAKRSRKRWEGLKSFKFSWFYLWAIISLFTILNITIFGITIFSSPQSLQVQYIPDDGFYYLVLARNFHIFNTWTFDSGNSITSGFHPLLAYVLTFLFSIFRPTNSEFIQIGILFSAISTLTLLIILWIIAFKRKNTLFLLFLALIAASRNYLHNSISIVEWSSIILIATLYYYLFFLSINRNRKQDILVIFILGMLGSLSRSDFGLLPISIFMTSIWSRNKNAVKNSTAGLIGAVFGILLIFIHNYFFTGEILQSSAQMKFFWGFTQGAPARFLFQLLPPLMLVLYSLGVEGNLINTILVTFLLLITFLFTRRSRNYDTSILGNNPMEFIIFISANICLIGYVILYSQVYPLQPWYTSNLIVPLFIIIYIIAKALSKRIKREYVRLTQVIVFVFIISIIIQNVAAVLPVNTSNSPWPHQELLQKAGIYINQNPLDGKVGSWNAGIINYFQGGTVINLDGLVNNDIGKYIRTNNLPDYLTIKEIIYLVDFEEMLYQPVRQKGGYDDLDFINRLETIMVFDEGQYDWKHLRIYKIDR